ncbi:hypothetical protein NHH03_06830 [Stieleria sp. TO1_6]|uniref:hypothetical protein n=1 Tax=Stieleria tagensis TaxID=2956795 RepID=UPI00209AEA14|nr:hypothetical protein [Stieleria tagensis]MCO8121445.1 hypothetical protein [Stieleria tagensis]
MDPSRKILILVAGWLCLLAWDRPVSAAGGSLTLILNDESSGEPVISRVEFFRGAAPANHSGRPEKQMPIRQTVPAGIGVVVDRQTVLELPDGGYRFRIVRGPEYRVISGTFDLEKTSLDDKTVALPRMVDMVGEGWLSGDCCVVPSANSVPLRMASEDLHVAAVLGDRPAKPIPRRDSDDPIEFDPIWIRSDVHAHQGLMYFGAAEKATEQDAEQTPEGEGDTAPDNSFEHLVAETSAGERSDLKVAIENPFAWELPVWLASGKIDGLFVMGDWLRLDKRVLSVADSRMKSSFSLGESTQLGRYAETIYRHLLDAGFSIVPLAGGGDQSAQTPLGYNRLYVTSRSRSSSEVESPTLPESESEWWAGVWSGVSVATNGPLLRPLVAGKLPGHVFTAQTGEVLELHPELNLAVRDPVEYLEVIHNNRIHYSARLDEFAKAGGKIPPIMAQESGWVIIRVMTLYEDHYRAAVTAPWWIEFDGRRRVSPESVSFFRDWLGDYEQRLLKLPPDELARYVPFIQAARRFWNQR